MGSVGELNPPQKDRRHCIPLPTLPPPALLPFATGVSGVPFRRFVLHRLFRGIGSVAQEPRLKTADGTRTRISLPHVGGALSLSYRGQRELLPAPSKGCIRPSSGQPSGKFPASREGLQGARFPGKERQRVESSLMDAFLWRHQRCFPVTENAFGFFRTPLGVDWNPFKDGGKPVNLP